MERKGKTSQQVFLWSQRKTMFKRAFKLQKSSKYGPISLDDVIDSDDNDSASSESDSEMENDHDFYQNDADANDTMLNEHAVQHDKSTTDTMAMMEDEDNDNELNSVSNEVNVTEEQIVDNEPLQGKLSFACDLCPNKKLQSQQDVAKHVISRVRFIMLYFSSIYTD